MINIEEKLYRDIFFTILLVIISIPIWLNFDVTALESARIYDDYSYSKVEYLNNPTYSLDPVSDNYALKHYETQDILVYNETNIEDEYNLVLRVDKKSTAKTDNIRISVNYYVDYLENYVSYEDDDYIYYVLDNKTLTAGSYKYVLSMWNDESAVVNDSDHLDFAFVVA